MTATERLRQLLDERGVEWRSRPYHKESVTTIWKALGTEFHYRENRYGQIRIHADHISPEQAVEATLGRGTCRNLIAHIQGQMPMLRCEECGCTTTLNVPSGGAGYIGETAMDWPLYCANCGRKVEP